MIARIIKMALLMLVFITAAGVSTYLTVHLLIRSQDSVVVPNLIGKEVVYALEVLTDLGLNTKVKQVKFDPTVPKHHIITQDPEPGTEIKHGRDVRLAISRGPRAVVVPNLAGLDLAQANIIIEQNGLGQGRLSRVYLHNISREEIVTQYPLSGSSALRGDKIDLLVSSGQRPETLQMIDITGMGLNQAIDRIEQSGLRVGTIATERHPNLSGDIVVAHSPDAGYPIVRGSLVGLTINQPLAKPGDSHRSPSALFRYRVPQGFLRQHLLVKISQHSLSVDIFDDFVKPGKEIWLSIPRHTATTLFLYVDGELIKSEHY